MPDWSFIARNIETLSGYLPDIDSVHAVSGGCISSAYILGEGEQRFFIKLSAAHSLAMFEAEYEGLQELASAEAICVPTPVSTGIAGSDAFLVMEYLPLGGSGSPEQLGTQLAALHRVQGRAFGWHRDNTIGATPQVNRYGDDWLDFWRRQRLDFQLQLAAKKGSARRLLQQGQALGERLAGLFHGYQPVPSLLHGDLWSGNYGYLRDGRPVIFDPAVYYGDRETDLAMTELFGGFPAAFYSAYQAAYPLDDGYAVRKTLYKLYHILNHYNLFGGGYLLQAESMLAQLLDEIR